MIDNKLERNYLYFFGSRDNYTHGLKELIANAVDELRNNNIEDPQISIIRESEDTIIC